MMIMLPPEMFGPKSAIRLAGNDRNNVKNYITEKTSLLVEDILKFHHNNYQNSRFKSKNNNATIMPKIQKRNFSLANIIIVVFIVFSCCCIPFAQTLQQPQKQQRRRLNEHISHYETLSYDTRPHLEKLYRSRRAVTEYDWDHPEKNPIYNLEFNSHGKNFSLRLKKDIESVFHRDIIIEDGDGKPLTIQIDHLVSGHLHREPNSIVFGSIRDGVFEGKIYSTNPYPETYYVEKANKYFPIDPIDIYLLDEKTQTSKYNLYDLVKGVTLSQTTSLSPTNYLPTLPFHSVIYSSRHVEDPYRQRRSPMDGACGANQKVREWMDSVANSAVMPEEDDGHNGDLTGGGDDDAVAAVSSSRSNRSKRASNYDYNSYRRHFEAQGRISYNRPSSPFQPSLSSSAPYLPSRRACSLYIQTDTFLWDHVKRHETEKSDFKVREEIASLVAQHIKAVNHIYETSIFKNIMGLKFIVQRLRINDSTACENKKRETNQFCSPNIDVSNFLNLNSQFNHNDFCLAYIFTYRDFSGGTLGLAWVASTSGASGGICEKYKTYTENIGGRQVQTKRSLNTGIITFVNYNSRVPPKVSELTLAHEIGHNFGSPHDYPAECRPGGPLGNYIMYSSATSGERQNNNKFSHCSISNISTVLNAVFNSEGKENCFQEDNGPFCGNKMVEDGEECDCGYDSRECNEDCCYPRNVDEFKHVDPDAQPCRRRPGAYCSPSEGPCCTEQCTFEGEKKQCRDDGECTYKSFCNGQRAHCPLPPAKPNKTECNMGTQVCWRGSCTGSICQKYNLEECFLTARRGAKPDEMCEVACQRRNQPETCRRTSEIEIMKNISGLKLRPGSPCNDFQGYCDVFQRCRPVDAEGPLAKLKNLLFNKKTLISIKQWIATYWWAGFLIGFAAILFMAAFIKCCAVHTPSSNPKRKKALKLSDTLRRPADTLRRKSRERSGGPSSNGQGQRSNRGHGRSAGHRHSSQNSNSHPNGPGTAMTAVTTTNTGATNQSSSNSVILPTAPITSTGPAGFATQFPLVVELPPLKDSAQPPVGIHHDPPPPYPGPPPKPTAPPYPIPAIQGGPSHGYGEGRGHYNRQSHSNTGAGSSSNGQSGGGTGNGNKSGHQKSSNSSGKKDSNNHHDSGKNRR